MSSGVPYIDGWARIPLGMFSPVALRRVQGLLTVHPKHFNHEEPAPKPLYLWDASEPGFIGVPIDWALEQWPDVRWDDRTITGGECFFNKLPDFNHPRASAGQEEFAHAVLVGMRDSFTLFIKAATGTGKTVVSLWAAAQLGRATLIIVQTVELGRQWVKEIQQHLGVSVDDIGWIQGDVCYWNKPFVVAVIHSLVGRAYPDAMYLHFGTILYDEAHRLGARSFSQSVGMFAARVKVCMTATPHRKDGCENVFLFYFGQPAVLSNQKALPCKVHSFSVACKVPHEIQMSGGIVSRLVTDDRRNDFLCKLINNLYQHGCNVLVIGDRIEHLQHLRTLLFDRIEPAEMGMFVGQIYTGSAKLSYPTTKTLTVGKTYVYWKAIGDDESVLPQRTKITVTEKLPGDVYVVRVVGGTDQFQVYAEECRMLPKELPETAKVSSAELDRVKRECRIIFATYGMMKEGQDVPRLDAGIDVTPRADGNQVLGRIRRQHGAKKRGTWYTIRDTGHPVLERYWESRIKDYKRSGAEVVDHGYLKR